MDLNAKSASLSHRLPGFSRKESPWDSEAPIREELFSVERLEAHARSLAIAQTIASRALEVCRWPPDWPTMARSCCRPIERS